MLIQRFSKRITFVLLAYWEYITGLFIEDYCISIPTILNLFCELPLLAQKKVFYILGRFSLFIVDVSTVIFLVKNELNVITSNSIKSGSW